MDGFIRNGAAGAKCIGTWRVYGNVEIAQRKFAQYKKCTRLYWKAFQKHRSFDRLVVRRSAVCPWARRWCREYGYFAQNEKLVFPNILVRMIKPE